MTKFMTISSSPELPAADNSEATSDDLATLAALAANSSTASKEPRRLSGSSNKSRMRRSITPRDAVNLERAALRVESMQTYAIVSSIIMGSSIGILSLTRQIYDEEEDTTAEQIAQYVLLLFQAISLVASSYTTVVFTLMALYYSTALGLGGDECYTAFDKDTKILRMRAFCSFVASIVTLMISFVPCVFLFVDGIRGTVMAAFIAVLVSVAFVDFKSAIDSAGRTIFNPLFLPNSQLGLRASQRRSKTDVMLDDDDDYSLMQDHGRDKCRPPKEYPRAAEIQKKKSFSELV